MRFFNPFLALSTVQSSKSAPSAIIHATSPAAKSSPIRSEATIAMVISSAEDTHFSLMSLMSAKYTRGSPLIMTAPHDGSSHIGTLMRNIINTTAINRNIPAMIVIFNPAKKSIACSRFILSRHVLLIIFFHLFKFIK